MEGDSTGEVSLAQVAGLGLEQLGDVQRADDNVNAGHDGVSLGQEVSVFEQLRLRDIGKQGELLLILGVSRQETAEMSQRDRSLQIM